MKIRKATKKDLNEIVELLFNDELGKTRESDSGFMPEEYVNAFDIIAKDPNQELIVVEDDTGVIIGTFQMTFIQYLTYQGGLRAQLEAVRVHEDFRGKGIGEKMVTWAIDRSKEKGAHVVQLTTNKKRIDALKFYKKLGFSESHEGMKLFI